MGGLCSEATGIVAPIETLELRALMEGSLEECSFLLKLSPLLPATEWRRPASFRLQLPAIKMTGRWRVEARIKITATSLLRMQREKKLRLYRRKGGRWARVSYAESILLQIKKKKGGERR
jgi:hypothetical protein